MSIKDRIALRKEAKQSWQRIKFGDSYNRKSDREVFYDRYFDCKWARRTAEKDAYKEVKAAAKISKEAKTQAMEEFASIYTESSKAKRFEAKKDWQEVKKTPRGLERRRAVSSYTHKHPWATLKRRAAKGLLRMAVAAVVSVCVYAGVARESNVISPSDIKVSNPNEYTEVFDPSSDGGYEKEPEEELPEPTEEEKEILEENKNHNNGSSVEMDR